MLSQVARQVPLGQWGLKMGHLEDLAQQGPMRDNRSASLNNSATQLPTPLVAFVLVVSG